MIERIPLTPETVALAKDILQSGFEGKFPPFTECFEPSEQVTAKHILFNQYREKTGCVIPKVFVYIVMDQLFGPCRHVDATGCAGYKLKLKP